MSSQPILPPQPQPLDAWAKQNLTALITAKSTDEFNTAFDQFISKNVTKIVFNGVSQTRDQYKDQLNRDRVNLRSATIEILDTVQAPKLDDHTSQTTGVVGLFFHATFEVQPPGPALPLFHEVHSSLNIEVEEDESVVGPIGIERRRVFLLNQVQL